MLKVDERNANLEKLDIQNILQSEHGRRFMWKLLCYCGIYRDVEPLSEDVMKQLGRRQVGLYLLGILSDIDDEKVFTMMREAKNKQTEDDYARTIEQSAIDNDDTANGSDSHDYAPGSFLSDYI